MRVPHMTRPVAILLVYAVFIMLVAVFGFFVIPSIVTQVTELAEVVPEYVDRAPEFIQWVEGSLARAGIEIDLQNRVQLDFLSDLATTSAQVVADNAVLILQSVVSLIFGVSLVVVISFYIVLDGGRRLHEALKVLPPRAEQEARFVLRTINDTFYGYVRGMLLVSMIYGVGTAGVMMGTGLPAALPVALISSILLAVPFVGDWLALALPLIVAAVAGDFITFIIVLAVLAIHTAGDAEPADAQDPGPRRADARHARHHCRGGWSTARGHRGSAARSADDGRHPCPGGPLRAPYSGAA